MPELLIKEAPGGVGDTYQCPTCSMMYLTVAIENGELTKIKVDPPRDCRRCGSPMDITRALAFQNQMAEQAVVPVRQQRTVKV